MNGKIQKEFYAVGWHLFLVVRGEIEFEGMKLLAKRVGDAMRPAV